MSNPLLEVNGLSVNFLEGDKKINAVSDISFVIEEGKTLGVVGESGCGKSVTANSILRLLPKRTSEIASGSIKLYGEDLCRVSDDAIREIRGNKISMIFQEPMTSLNPVYRIGYQMVEGILVHQHMTKQEAFEKSVAMLEKVGIPEARTRMRAYPHELSGGMRQRVMIAMALSSDPALLIADEPTTALDVTIQAQVLELMENLKKSLNTAIMLITHDMGVVSEVSDYVMVMYAGEVVEYDDVVSIFENPLHPYTQGLLKSIPRFDQDVDRLYTINGTVPSLKEMPKGCRFCTRCPYATDRCRSEKPPLLHLGSHQVRCFRYEEGGQRHDGI